MTDLLRRPRFASLTAGLLARKGEAQPAASGFSRDMTNSLSAAAEGPSEPPKASVGETGNEPAKEAAPRAGLRRRSVAEVLGQAKQSEDKEAARPTSKPPAEDQDPCAEACPDTVAAEPSGAEPPYSEPKRTTVSVRLEASNYIKLRLAAAHLGKTQAEVIGAALELYLRALEPHLTTQCACLRKRLFD